MAGTDLRFMTLGAAAPIPVGFSQFCGRNPSACGQPDTATAARAAADSARLVPAAFSLRDFDRGLRDEDGADGEALHTSAFSAASLEAPVSDRPAAPVADTGVVPGPPPIRLGPIAFLAIPSLVTEAPRIAMSRETGALLTRVNRRVNRMVRPRSDMQINGRAEFWSLPVAINGSLYGDCEDYALQKKADLVEAGLPAAAMTMAVAHTRDGLVHAVLVVSTDQGDLILDNRSPWVTPWAKVRYNWVMRQVSGQSMQWARIEAAPAG